MDARPAFAKLSSLVVAAFTLAACSADNPDIAGGSVLQPDLSTVWFDVSAGRPAPASVTIRNVGSKRSSSLSTTLHGDIEALAIAQDDCVGRSLPPNTACEIQLTLQSDVAGTYEGQLVIAQAGAAGVEVELRGKVPLAALRLTAPSPRTEVAVGEIGAIPLVIENVGGGKSGPLELTADGGLTVTSPCLGISLASGQKCEFAAQLRAPGAPTTIAGVVTATADPGGTQTVPLVFDVIPAYLDVYGSYQVLLTGSTGKDVLSVYNPTSSPVMWTDAAVVMDTPANDDACVISADPCTGKALDPGATCEIGIQCTPHSVGRITGRLELRDANGLRAKGSITVFGAVAMIRVTYAGAGRGAVEGPAGGYESDENAATFGLVDANAFTITAKPKAGSRFSGWSGACSGTATTCTVTPVMSSVVTAEARFD